jgi:predicted secreted protein
MAPKRGASKAGPRKTQGKKAAGGKPSNQKAAREIGALAKLEKVAAQDRTKSLSGTEPRRPQEVAEQSTQRPATLTSASAPTKFDASTFTVACVVAVALVMVGYYYLSSIQIPVSKAFSSDAVRLETRLGAEAVGP